MTGPKTITIAHEQAKRSAEGVATRRANWSRRPPTREKSFGIETGGPWVSARGRLPRLAINPLGDRERHHLSRQVRRRRRQAARRPRPHRRDSDDAGAVRPRPRPPAVDLGPRAVAARCASTSRAHCRRSRTATRWGCWRRRGREAARLSSPRSALPAPRRPPSGAPPPARRALPPARGARGVRRERSAVALIAEINRQIKELEASSRAFEQPRTPKSTAPCRGSASALGCSDGDDRRTESAKSRRNYAYLAVDRRRRKRTVRRASSATAGSPTDADRWNAARLATMPGHAATDPPPGGVGNRLGYARAA